jgi:hypothetical protein
MRVIKLALISLVTFFGIITTMSLLIPSQVRISRAINIASADRVLFLVATHNQWPRWHPLFQASDAAGLPQKDNFTLNTIEASDSTVRVDWMQPGKTTIINGWQLHQAGSSDSVTLQWYMDFKLKWYPWQKFSSLFYEKTYGTLMEQGLQNIKSIMQAPEP